MTSEILKIILEAVVSLTVVLITGYILPWLSNKLGADKYELIREYCILAVRSAEQLYTAEEWAKKKTYVESCISAKLNSVGLELSELEVNALIEGCVNLVKKG